MTRSVVASQSSNALEVAPAESKPAEISTGEANRILVSDFELGHAPGDFHHADHVRLAFAYVAEFPLPEAIGRFSAGLQRFATAKGKPNLYHATITWTYLLLIHERLARCGHSQTWKEFAECNPDLLVWKSGILHRYYSQATLDSDLARSTFLFPDHVRRPDGINSGGVERNS